MKRHFLLWIMLIMLSLMVLQGETALAEPPSSPKTAAPASPQAAGVPGSYDPDFGASGYTLTAFSQGNSTAYAAAFWEKAGKIIVVGSVETASNGEDLAIVSLHLDGSRNYGFGTSGTVVTSLSSVDDRAYAVAVTDNGEIIVGGYTQSGNGQFFLARYFYDGSPKTSFGNNGVVLTDFSSGIDVIRGLTVQDDGKIVVAGQAEISGGCPAFAEAYYNRASC
jgi:uncharacterized delta-60 repeat protein